MRLYYQYVVRTATYIGSTFMQLSRDCARVSDKMHAKSPIKIILTPKRTIKYDLHLVVHTVRSTWNVVVGGLTTR